MVINPLVGLVLRVVDEEHEPDKCTEDPNSANCNNKIPNDYGF